MENKWRDRFRKMRDRAVQAEKKLETLKDLALENFAELNQMSWEEENEAICKTILAVIDGKAPEEK